jgi:hypothetical protein
MAKRVVRVRILQPVTYGTSDTWQVGDVVRLDPALAAVMVSAGEAVYVIGREPIAVASTVTRTR